MTARRGEEEQDVLLQLFDLYWFKQHVLTNQPVIEDIFPKPQSLYHKTSSLHPIKSFTYQSLSSKEPISFNGAHSPSSVLAISPFDDDSSYKNAGLHGDEEQGDHVKKSKKANEKIRKRRVIERISGISKSLLELEIQEIKGFMDLGFTFSEEDKRSPRLVSILPGLQKPGSKEGQWKQDFEEASERVVSRPLLIMKKKKKNWRLPSSRNEIDMKNHLRMWAHAVASVVWLFLARDCFRQFVSWRLIGSSSRVFSPSPCSCSRSFRSFIDLLLCIFRVFLSSPEISPVGFTRIFLIHHFHSRLFQKF